MRKLDAVLDRHVAAVRACDPGQAPLIEAAARLLPRLLAELGLRRFLGAVLIDAKPRLLLRFQADPAGALGELASDVVLKVYGDRPRGEGPLLALWRARGVNTPRVRFGEHEGCSWLALEHLALSALRPHGSTEVLALTEEMAAQARLMHAPVPRLTPVLRPLDAVMLPRWDASVAALRSAGHDVPERWRSGAATAYRTGARGPLHGDLGITNVARDPRGELLVYDASAFLGPRAFDGVRWAARLSDDAVSPNEVLDRWTEVKGAAPRAAPDELLAAECILEAGSLEIVRQRGSPEQSAHGSGLHASAVRLVTFARGILGS